MEAFVVLGIVPGSNFQINFEAWLQVVSVIISALITLAIYRKRSAFIAMAVNLYKFATTRRLKLTARAV